MRSRRAVSVDELETVIVGSVYCAEIHADAERLALIKKCKVDLKSRQGRKLVEEIERRYSK